MTANLLFPLSPYEHVALILYHMNFFLFSFIIICPFWTSWDWNYLLFISDTVFSVCKITAKTQMWEIIWLQHLAEKPSYVMATDTNRSAICGAQPAWGPRPSADAPHFLLHALLACQHSLEKTSKMNHHSTQPSAPPAPQHTRPSTTLSVSRSQHSAKPHVPLLDPSLSGRNCKLTSAASQSRLYVSG